MEKKKKKKKKKVYCKNVQHIKIYLPCNFEVNPITDFDPIMQI